MPDLTEAELKKLGLFCGLTLKVTPSQNHEGEYWTWLDLDGREVEFTASLPDLFERAVPKVKFYELRCSYSKGVSLKHHYAQIRLPYGRRFYYGEHPTDPATALARAILKAIEGE